ncbi:MAG TPA: nitrophenyl compound nitroreductase subunit ArsF family protein [Bacteroidales bacterium]|nr:nitrophenyl compound nitroreductase subunit ArsF family protein [Bacteroidales bacterium]
MKKFLFLVLMLNLIAWTPLPAQTQSKKLEVFYFHGTRRCPTCMAIEANTRKTLDTYFAGQVKSGAIRMTVIDVDDPKNKAIAERYEAAGSALFVTVNPGEKEKRNDMTEFAFSCARSNPTKFMSGLKDKIRELLK